MELKQGYKQTKAGLIPDDWEACALQDLIDRTRPIAYGVLKPGEYVLNGIPLLQIQDVIHGEIEPTKIHRIGRDLDAQYSRTRLQGGEIVVSLVGTIGKVARIPARMSGANLHRNLARIAVSARNSSDFVFHALRADGVQSAVKLSTFGSTQSLLNLADLRRLPIAIPRSHDEQRAIAEALSDVDALLAAVERLIAKKRDLKQTAMQQLLTAQIRLPGFTGEWERGPLDRVVGALDAGVSVNSTDDEDAGTHEASILKTSAVVDGQFLPHECKRIASRDIRRAKLNPRRNTVLISRMNTPDLVGECGYVSQDFPHLFVPDRLWLTRFRSENSVNAQWLAFLLSTPPMRKCITSAATGTSGSMKNLSKSSFLAIEVSYPSPAEQTAIAEVLSDMDAEIAALTQRRDKTRALKQAMMQELLTGRTRLV